MDKEMDLIKSSPVESLFIESVGAAVYASAYEGEIPSLESLLMPAEKEDLEKVPGLALFLDKVKHMKLHNGQKQKSVPEVPETKETKTPVNLILGFDIGSTGSKALALDIESKEIIWDSYLNTNGDPVNASRALMQRFVDSQFGNFPVLSVGATGSGREIVGSLMTNCYGGEHVYILNEIAAHAEGAVHYDPRVDTIFEIGGQDAKYIRLSKGKVIDAAMNEACSAGTGSFIEEQGKKFSNIQDVVHLGEEGLKSEYGVSLGQHCSVFMAEIIDEAVAAGIENPAIIAGIYDSIIQNYLNRVKGNRSVGDVIFCQGMPFSSDALATAVAKETGGEVIIPPNPGTTGALGISLLTRKAVDYNNLSAIDPQRFLNAEVVKKDTFTCKSKKGCGNGNLCKIDRISTIVDGKKQKFKWGGGCSLYSKGIHTVKLPDLAPDPFREREALIDKLIASLTDYSKKECIAMTDEFQLKSLFPFFSVFINELGFNVKIYRGADHVILKKGIEQANIPFCAPMQQYHGLVAKMAEEGQDFIFSPMIRGTLKIGDENNSALCPIVQAAPDIMKLNLSNGYKNKIIAPLIDIGFGNLDSEQFLNSCKELALHLGVNGKAWIKAHKKAKIAQKKYTNECLALGENALKFCEENNIIPILVQGRPYTIYNKVLNSNVPSILREQGAIPIPIDCYKLQKDTPMFYDMYWGYGQYNLQAAHQIRRTKGIYSLWCSNYSCGPDSFSLHFFNYIMDGKPNTVIETDGHSGDAGTKTRVEAFLHCVREDIQAGDEKKIFNFKDHEKDGYCLYDVKRENATVLIPRMGPGADSLVSCLRNFGVKAESLPMPERESVRIGRRYTSGKECVPMTVTLGSLLQRIEGTPKNEKFAFFMPTADGPCRFGVYNILHKIVLEHLGYTDKVRLWSPTDSDYFEGLPPGFSVYVFAGFAAEDMLLASLYDVRPVEKNPGDAKRVYDHYKAKLVNLLENVDQSDLSVRRALLQVANGRLFGTTELLKKAAKDFAKVKKFVEVPTVSMVGEIYVRCDPFSNDFAIDKLEQRGIRVRFAPFTEWLEYCDYFARIEKLNTGFNSILTSFVKKRILTYTYSIISEQLKWPKRTSVKDTIKAASPYIRKQLNGEAILTVGGPLHEWHEGVIDGVISVGPLECMPTKIAENHFCQAAEVSGLLSLTLALNGDPVDPEILDTFAFEVKSKFKKRMQRQQQIHQRKIKARKYFSRTVG
jgi:predicted CoA-substrate-specific enzyme activase